MRTPDGQDTSEANDAGDDGRRFDRNDRADRTSADAGGGSLPFFWVIAGTGVLEMAVRTVPELLGLGDAVAVPVLARLLVFQTVLADTLGWAVGWLLFWLFVFYFAPEFYPQQWLAVANGLLARSVTATGVVATGVTVEWALTELLLDVDVSPLTPPDVVAAVAGIGLVSAGFAAASGTRPIEVGTWLLARPDVSRVALDTRMGRGAFVVRATCLTVVLGTLLAEVSLLYPLPEVYLLAVVVRESLDAVFETDGLVLTREDIAERAAVGATGVWAPLQFALVPLYGGFVLFTTLVPTLLSLYRIDQQTLATHPLVVGTYVFAVTGGVVYVVVYVTRVFSRLPTRVRASAGHDPGASEAVESARPPGFLFPAALAIGVAMLVAESTDPPPWVVGAGLVAGAIALLAAYDDPEETVPVPDDLAVPVAASTAIPGWVLLADAATSWASFSPGTALLVWFVFACMLGAPGVVLGAVAYRRRHPSPEQGSVHARNRLVLTAFGVTAVQFGVTALASILLPAESLVYTLVVGVAALLFLVALAGSLVVTVLYWPPALGHLVRAAVAAPVTAPRWFVAALRRQYARLAIVD
jgi:hypothetical protein